MRATPGPAARPGTASGVGGDQDRPGHPFPVGGGAGGRQECVDEARTEKGKNFFFLSFFLTFFFW